MSSHPRRSRGFTLVEILVVVAIIVILMAILIPTAMGMISKARNAAIGVELSQLATGFNEYKKEHGDFPPSMGGPASQWIPANRYSTVAERHLLRCYPKIDPAHKTFFYDYIAPNLDTSEVVVFWLSTIANDPRYPFKNLVVDGSGILHYAPTPGTNAPYTRHPGPYPRFVHFEFDERRLFDVVAPQDTDPMPAYRALYCKETPYVYFDSRTYLVNCLAGNIVQPMTDGAKIAKLSSTLPASLPQKQDPSLQMFMNPNTFQVHCAGQDGNYGFVPTVFNGSGVFINWDNTKQFPNMLNTNEEDSDNMADFTEGRKLIDHRAP